MISEPVGKVFEIIFNGDDSKLSAVYFLKARARRHAEEVLRKERPDANLRWWRGDKLHVVGEGRVAEIRERSVR